MFSRSGDEDESPETKAERERLRRQANNARERYVLDLVLFLSHQLLCIYNHRTSQFLSRNSNPCLLYIQHLGLSKIHVFMFLMLLQMFVLLVCLILYLYIIVLAPFLSQFLLLPASHVKKNRAYR